ncbi:MAG: alanine--glyoxylate aminotransferase family protein [Dehalococcoidia bacterium]
MREINLPARILMGPGPSNVHPRVMQALSSPTVGHMDPTFIELMDSTVELLREVFQTKNFLTLPVSGTGSAAMEAALGNILEPGDTVIIGLNGFFGDRMSQMASRWDVEVVLVEAEWGHIIEPEAIGKELRRHKKVKLVAMVHAETSTGVLQPLEEIGKLAHEHGALYLVDTVASLAGCHIPVDEWGIDICYSGSQKCLSCPPGIAPITLNDAAIQALDNRKSKVHSWYLDLSLIKYYWGTGRTYHHTAPINMIYALREALRVVLEEGLENCFARHHRNGCALRAGLEAMRLKFLAPESYRADMITAVMVPDGVDGEGVRQVLLNDFNIEISGGLGPLKGKIWRVGLMGQSSKASNVLGFLTALEQILTKEGFEVPQSAGVNAANKILATS